MSILSRYIAIEFLKLLMLTVSAFVLIFVMIDLSDNVDNLLQHSVPLIPSAVFCIYKIPFMVSQIAPVSVLVAVMIALGILDKHGEITAIKAGGVRLLRVMAPLLLLGLAISVAIILMDEYVTPRSLKKVDSFKKQWFGMQERSIGREGMWMRTSSGIINIKRMDLERNQLQGVTAYQIDKPFLLKKRVSARELKWQDGRWFTDKASFRGFGDGVEAGTQTDGDYVLEGLAGPEDLVNIENLHKNMGFMELRQYIKGLEEDGYETTRYRIDLYGKLAFPFVNFVMVLVGIPFALKTGRHSGIATGLGLSVAIAFSYWVVFAVTRSLGQGGVIPPLVASAFPVAIFLAIGALMIGYVRE